MSKLHAKLSASGSAKWFLCAGSVKAEEGIPNKSSIFADEGTAAHELAEMCLTSGKQASDFEGDVLPESNAFTVSPEMTGFIQQYVDYVRGIKGTMFIEQQVDFSHIAPEAFGTADAIVINGDAMHVIDLKYGKGIPVSAVENTQGILYALGALNDYGMIYNIKAITLVIVQPRLDNISEWTISVDDLARWGERLKQAAELALTDNAPRTHGEKQCQWCRAKATCPTLKNYAEGVILSQFDDLNIKNPDTLTDGQLFDALEAKKLVNSWFEAVEQLVTDRLATGGAFAGYKLVEGRSNRAWADEQQAVTALADTLGADLYTRKIISPTQAEKVLGKSKVSMLDGLVTKPPGAPTLVPESDKRPSIIASFD